MWTLLAAAQLAHPPLALGGRLSSLPSPFPLSPLPKAMGSPAPSTFALFQASLKAISCSFHSPVQAFCLALHFVAGYFFHILAMPLL